MQRILWTERVFTFNIPEGWLTNILERLRGTPVRLSAFINKLPEELLTFKQNNKWSIKEHIGHLSDLEDLHEGRIDDFIKRKKTFRAADMNNAKTYAAKHNNTNVQELIKNFAEKRKVFINRLETLDDNTLQFQALHPRLKALMKPVDMAFFTAEHDDHHLASIREIIKLKYQRLPEAPDHNS